MSEELFKSDKEDFCITSFCGKGKEICIQFTMHEDYTQPTKEEVKEIIKVLKKWIKRLK